MLDRSIYMKPKQILIGGMGKSGTTVLYYKLAKSMPAVTEKLFEPVIFSYVTKQVSGWILLKTLMYQRYNIDASYLNQYSHKIILVRDPRDMLVSGLLYSLAYHYAQIGLDVPQLTEVIKLIKQKEKEPQSISFMKLLSFTTITPEVIKTEIDVFMDVLDKFSGYFIYEYESMIDKKFSELEEYLGLKVVDADVGPDHVRVARTKGYGSWKHWFTPEDIVALTPAVKGYVDKFKYDDWELSSEPTINPNHASQYVIRNLPPGTL